MAFLPLNQIMEVTQQTRDNSRNVWFRVRTIIAGNYTEGWVRSDTVQFFGDPCEDIP
jgi:hypothetical protein